MTLYNHHTDTQLLKLLPESNEAAFAVLFERYRNKLYYYLLKHTKSPEVAEEIVTDIFMKLWMGRELAGQITDLGAFLHKVGFYKAMDFLRTTARHASLQQIYIERMELPYEKQADELLINEEMKRQLYNAVNALPPQRKLIYQLSRRDGLTHEQIATALNLSRSTVNNALGAATRSISEYLGRQNAAPGILSAFFLLG